MKGQPLEFYPDGRHAWRDIYTDKVVAEITQGTDLREAYPHQLKYELCIIAEIYVTIAAGNRLGTSYKDHISWLDKNVLKPAKLLRVHLGEEFLDLYEDWIQPVSASGHAIALRRPLDEAISAFSSLKDALLQQKATGTKKNTDFRYALVWDLTLLYARVFRERPKRIHASKIDGIGNAYAQFVRRAAKPILSRHEHLDHQMQIAVEKYSLMKK
jgi:hypothetical protein